MKQHRGQGFSAAAIGSNYDSDETEFLMAMEKYMATTHRRFPSFTEVLAVARSLGYRKPDPLLPALPPPPVPPVQKSKWVRKVESLLSDTYDPV